MTPELLPFGIDGLLIRLSLTSTAESQSAVQHLYAQIRAASLPGVTQVATSLATVLVRFDPAQTNRATVSAQLEPLLQPRAQPPAQKGRLWTIPAAFDGPCAPHLAEVANLTGQTQAQAIGDILNAKLRVLAIGFAPGQPYLGLLPEAWNFPRQDQLVPRVPVGAIVVAVRQVVLFSAENTTGWRQVGQVAFKPFDPNRAEPFALRNGDRIRFAQVPQSELDTLRANAPNGLGGARCEDAP